MAESEKRPDDSPYLRRLKELLNRQAGYRQYKQCRLAIISSDGVEGWFLWHTIKDFGLLEEAAKRMKQRSPRMKVWVERR